MVMEADSQSQAYGARNHVFNKRYYHGDKKKKKRKHGGDFSKVYIKSSSFHFWGKNAVLVLMDSKSKR